jgi:threonine 3-dehydrogenase
VAFESSGAASAYPLLFDAVRREGMIVGIGHPSREVEVDIAKYINKKGITLRGVFGRRLWDTWEELANLLASGRLDIEWIISHRLPLVDLEEIIDLLGGEANKVLVLPNGDPSALRS